MGSGFEANCNCGFHQEHIDVGCGMAMDFLVVAGPCKTCKKIVGVALKMPLEEEDIPAQCICPECKNPFQPYHEIAEYDYEHNKKPKFDCPQCGKKKLQFKCTLMWD
jgi:hypothetical protein